MANVIEVAKQFIPVLDAVYKEASLTAVLDGNPELVQEGANAGELIIPMLDMQGMADYSRNGGYVDGDVTLRNETVKCNYDRGRMFSIDAVDNIEAASVPMANVSGEFIRTKVSPEEDAFRIASYAGKEGISKVETGAELADGPAVIAAVRAGMTRMDDDEVPQTDRYLFIRNDLHGLVSDMDTNKSREVLSSFAGVIKMPPSRFYTAIAMKSGKNGEAAGGYAKAVGAKDINFMIIHKPAVIQFPKHVAPKIVTPEQNQSGDAWKFGYRKVSIADVYKNKLAGIYLHHKP